jgi:hypothetical protein
MFWEMERFCMRHAGHKWRGAHTDSYRLASRQPALDGNVLPNIVNVILMNAALPRGNCEPIMFI